MWTAEEFERVTKQGMTPEMREMYESAHAPPCPKDIMDLAQHNALVRAARNYWLAGKLSWEEMLIRLVVSLAAQNKQMQDDLFRRMQMETNVGLPK